jgi:hypothetical protein
MRMLAGWFAPGALVLVAACSSSTSGSGGGGGTDGGGNTSCKSVMICATTAHLNMLCGTMATTATPNEVSQPDQLVDNCEYKDMSGRNMNATHYCFTDPAGAAMYYDAARNDSSPKGTKVDVSGIGDKAFFQEEPDVNIDTLFVLRGNVLVFVELDGVVTAQNESMLEQQCIKPIMNEILAL